MWSAEGVYIYRGFAGLILKQVYRMAGVVPQQMVGPTARLAQGIHICPSKEVRFHDQMLNREFTGLYPVMDPLMTGIKTSDMVNHRHHACFFLHLHHPFGVGQ